MLFRIAKKIFDNSTAFNSSNDMFNDNPDTGDEAVLLLLFWGKFFPFGLLARLKRLDSIRFITLKSSIFIHPNVLGIGGIFFISNLFIMPFALVSLAQIIDFARMDAANNEILDRVCFFLPL